MFVHFVTFVVNWSVHFQSSSPSMIARFIRFSEVEKNEVPFSKFESKVSAAGKGKQSMLCEVLLCTAALPMWLLQLSTLT